MQATMALDIPGPDEPIPCTLTTKAVAFLDQQDRYAAENSALVASGEMSAAIDDGPGEYEWECTWCGSVFFGTAPEDATCEVCRDDA